ncbi:unnamed protein product [Didymodactylos carnosus]|uniref:EF-hand domain-containing protein n=1 Tax=Didymodactylos carnosus TaxID=1234261 RepID=A0A814H248_9BILA|nr:unnamed protein product [Didymodactylos carnosus]CAF1003767.1 unnamed protein product [Didymodactylos carnosus]CAF3645118.1 unnamed protein product [Didymodactylos carnosus]CAF3775147.1 unnamed protein product [Didymodactylos carnosus]
MGTRNSKNQTNVNLSDKDFEKLKKITDKNDEDIEQWFDKFRQTYSDGYLDKKGLSQMIKELHHTNYIIDENNEKYFDYIAERIFSIFDKNHDGKIELTTFINDYIAKIEGNNENKLNYSFEIYDHNKDNFIDINELKTVLRWLFCILNISEVELEAQVITIMTMFDKDNDEKLSRQEWTDGCSRDVVLAKLLDPFLLTK